MSSPAARLRLFIVMLAWLAQALMPVVHAATMSATGKAGQAWCGEAASAKAALAILPAELRAALDEGGQAAEHLEKCTLLCAVGTATPPPVDMVPAAALRAAGLEPVLAPLSKPAARSQSPTPPAHAPPALG